MRPPTAGDLEREGGVRFEFFRASGPGGQNVNKVETAVRLRFDLRGSRLLPGPVKERVRALAGSRVTADGTLMIEARRFRTQERNRDDALARLEGMIAGAWSAPTPRRETRPTLASRRRRLEGKRRRADVKAGRGRPDDRD